MTPAVLDDALGPVVDLVAGIEPALGRAHIEQFVAGVAGGQAKRRRLAQALVARPSLLRDGLHRLQQATSDPAAPEHFETPVPNPDLPLQKG